MIVIVNEKNLFLSIHDSGKVEVGFGKVNHHGDVEVEGWLFDILPNNTVEFAGAGPHEGLIVTEGRTI